MFNLQGSEIIFILLLALVVLGPEKLPGAIRRFTKTYAELRKMGTSFQDEVKSAFDEPLREVRETADLIKDQVDMEGLEAELEASEALDESAAKARAKRLDAPPDDTGNEAAIDHDDESAPAPIGQGPNPATVWRPLEPPVAGTAQDGPNDDPAAATTNGGGDDRAERMVMPPPPAPFAGSGALGPPPARLAPPSESGALPASAPGDTEASP
ncbi:MAG: hypothetical protein AAFP84_03765 [Actinomycetota bacterium]